MTPPANRLYLFGAPRLERHAAGVALDRRKAIALLAYVALGRQVPNRDQLATIFWPESDQAHARGALRQTVSALVAAVGGEVLDVSREHIALKSSPDLWVDALEFVRLAQQPPPDAAGLHDQARRMISLYAGEFMRGFTLADAPEFDRWQAHMAETLRASLANCMSRACESCLITSDFEGAINIGRRWLEVDASDESAHRALMRAFAANGQRSLALRQFFDCVDSLKREYGVAPSTETAQLYENIQRETLAAPAHNAVPRPAAPKQDAAQPDAARHNLPRQTTSFVGRQAELQQLHKLLNEEPDCRLITLVGPGGMGKTRLGLQAAAHSVGRFEHGVFFVPLAALESPAFLAEAIAEATGFAFYSQSNPMRQLLGFLQNKHMLLVLDNFEHLLAGAPLLGELLAGTSGLKLLVTCRERLHVQAEWIVDVEGLAHPDNINMPVAEARSFASVKLFEQRARQLSTRFDLERDLTPVLEIARLTVGMPLALEMAAAWTRVLKPADILTEILANTGFLQHHGADVPERHRSLHAIFQQSWRFLAPHEQDVLARLAVFRGGFARDAAQAVAEATPSLLATLADRALVQMRHDGRGDIHELLRQFLLDQLDVQSREQAQRLHSEWFAKRLAGCAAALNGPREAPTLSGLAPDFDNCRAAWLWSAQHGYPALLVQSAHGLAGYLARQTRHTEALALMQAALDAIEGNDGADAMRARAICGIQCGIAAYRLSKLTEAEHVLKQNVALAIELDMTAEAAGGRSVLGESLVLRGQRDAGLIELHAAVDTARRNADDAALASALNFLGYAEYYGGDFEAASVHLNESLALWRSRASEWNIARVSNNLGLLRMSTGKYAQARQLFGACFETWRNLDAPGMTAMALNNLGAVAILEGTPALAIPTLEQALDRYCEIGSRIGQAQSHFNLGRAAFDMGDFAQAQSRYQHSYELYRDIGDLNDMASALARLGQVALAAGDTGAAADHVRNALTLCARHSLHTTREGMLIAAQVLARRSPQHALVIIGQLLDAHGLALEETAMAHSVLRMLKVTEAEARAAAAGLPPEGGMPLLAKTIELLEQHW